jgi:hypothetical protein
MVHLTPLRSNDRVINELERMRKGCTHSLIYGTIPAFAFSNWGKSQKPRSENPASVSRLQRGTSLNTNQEWQPFDSVVRLISITNRTPGPLGYQDVPSTFLLAACTLHLQTIVTSWPTRHAVHDSIWTALLCLQVGSSLITRVIYYSTVDGTKHAQTGDIARVCLYCNHT